MSGDFEAFGCTPASDKNAPPVVHGEQVKKEEHEVDEEQEEEEQQQLKTSALKRERTTTKFELQALYDNFETLDHYFVGKNGKAQSHRACICKHCESAGEPRQELARYRKSLETHLEHCKHFGGTITPPKKRAKRAPVSKAAENSSADNETDAPPERRSAYDRMKELESIKEFLSEPEFLQKRQAILDSV